MVIGTCLKCKKPVEFDDQAYWQRRVGEEYLLHKDCLLDSWIDGENLEPYLEKEV